MLRPVLMLLAALALGACVAGGGTPGADAITETPLGDIPQAIVAADDQAAATPEPASPPASDGGATDLAAEAAPGTASQSSAPPPAPPSVPPIEARARAECADRGGIFTSRGSGLFVCVQPTRDAGRTCRANSDCQGLCLARSGSCAPFTPLYGCNDVLTAPGRRETLCLD